MHEGIGHSGTSGTVERHVYGLHFYTASVQRSVQGANDILDSTLRDVRECPEGECMALALSTV